VFGQRRGVMPWQERHAAAILGTTLIFVLLHLNLSRDHLIAARVRRKLWEQRVSSFALAVPGDGPVTQPRPLRRKLPDGFNWRLYRLLHPELHLTSEPQVARQYLRHGQQEGRCYRGIPVVRACLPWPALSPLSICATLPCTACQQGGTAHISVLFTAFSFSREYLHWHTHTSHTPQAVFFLFSA
jgi:hypothetical protein